MEALYITFFVFTGVTSSVRGAEDVHTLRSISVVFRHGDRTPSKTEFYPNDPYKDCTFDPVGNGGLTNNGRRREYQLGLQLRNRYDSFLGDTYRSSEVSVVSTDYERTRMSLQLVLAGLYPPKDKQVWNEYLDWQPIPSDFVPEKLSTYLKPTKCPVYENELKQVRKTEEYRNEVAKYADLMEKLTDLTGKNISDTEATYNLYLTLEAESAMNLSLPEWTKDYFPEGPIIDAAVFEYKTRSYTKLLTKLNGGSFIKKILDDTVLLKNESEIPKVHLYSVHNENVAGLLQALNSWNNFKPRYSSAVIVELHKIDSKFYYKFVQYKGIPAEFKEITLPGCSEYCLLDDFLDLCTGIVPDDVLEACFGPPDDSYLIEKSGNPYELFYEKIRKWFNL